MSECGAVNPNDPESVCIVEAPGHGYHADDKGEHWPDTERIKQVREQETSRRSTRRRGTLYRIANGARKGKQGLLEGDEEAASGPIVRTEDPDTAHEAAERYEPKRDSAKGRVLGYLRERLDQWVDAPELTHDSVGGFAGTRRLRELREAGWPIETRPKPGYTNTWQHRLVSDVGNLSDFDEETGQMIPTASMMAED